MPKHYFLLILSLLMSLPFFSQEEGSLQFIGHDLFNNKNLLNTEVKVVSAGTSYTTISTGDSKDFKLNLPFGAIYDLYFYNRRTQTMYLRVMADNVPKNKYNLRTTYELDIPFFPKDSKNLDTTQFKNPFHKIYFDGKRFKDDTAYMAQFLDKVYLKIQVDTMPPQPVIQPQVGTLVGNIVYDTKDKTPVKNRIVVLETKEGKELSTTHTTENGTFVFQNTKLEEAYKIKVKFDDTDNPPGQKIIIKNSNSDIIETATINETRQAGFENTAQNNLIKRLVDNVFTYKIAGKLASTDGSTNKIIADKYVYLLSDRNNLVQKVKTNALGVFLFTNIKPNLHYSIAVDDKDCGTPGNCKLVLFNTKDKKLRIIDSLSQNKFVYKFLAVSNSEFNSLLVEDADLKMNVKGKIYGNNTNNPIDNMKVLLLNDKYETIDTAVTAKNGSFLFKNAPYARQLILSADSGNSILEAFNNIMVYDNNDNLIKIVSLIKGGKFIYKALKTEQGRLADVYVDDPWLSLIDKNYQKGNKAKTQVITENIRFDFNKYELLPEARQTLDKAIMAMQLNPSITVDLSAHTDSKGSDPYNLKLSENRANSAKQYLVAGGVNENRIKAMGYGETRLLNRCDNKTNCPEEEHAVNRRIEFKLNFN